MIVTLSIKGVRPRFWQKWGLPPFITLFILLLLAAAPTLKATTYADNPVVTDFIQDMVAEGFDAAQLRALFAKTQRKDRIIELMNQPAEAKPWKDYRPIFVTPQRINQGVEFYYSYHEALRRAESMFGVPAALIVAVIGVETRYGRNTGGFRVMDALATLAFDYPSRQDYFSGELKNFLRLTRDAGLDPLELQGSYAGAMGYGQFMPSSYLSYAIDFDGDKLADIWNNPVDAIGSVANYLHRHGWQPGEPVVQAAVADGESFRDSLATGRTRLEPELSLSEWQQKGLQPADQVTGNPLAMAVELEVDDGNELWFGWHNFYVITRYNHSALYAMAVYQLSDAISREVRND